MHKRLSLAVLIALVTPPAHGTVELAVQRDPALGRDFVVWDYHPDPRYGGFAIT